MLTCAGRVAIQTMASATSSATSGLGTPAYTASARSWSPREAGQRELVGAHHPRRDEGDPHRLVDQLQAQRLGHHVHAVLGHRVAATALVGRGSRRSSRR